MYKCLQCGHIFDEGEQDTWSESRGECFGFPCSEEMSGCPLCRGDYEKTVDCKICGSEHLRDELNMGVCDECIEEYQHDIDMCFKIGAGDGEKVEINCFLASMFDREEIDKILFEKLKEKEKYIKEIVQINCEKFVENNRDWFAERLLEEV